MVTLENKKNQSLTLSQKFFKRVFDIIFSFIGLLILSPLIVIVSIITAVNLHENGFFFQIRVGKNGKLFKMVKIKTMRSSSLNQSSITSHNDSRISNLGALLRKTKIDELPQLWNVLIGQMSVVGPRPDVQGYADNLHGRERIILSIKPGITGPAQLYFKNESLILSNQDNLKEFNDNVIWPKKIRINMQYIENYSFYKDFYYIWKTII